MQSSMLHRDTLVGTRGAAERGHGKVERGH